MKLRPCIDIHNGSVKQIVGGSLRDAGDFARENFVAKKEQDAAYFAEYYKKRGLTGGHIILLHAADSPFFAETRAQALSALSAYPQAFQVGGGVTPKNAEGYLAAGASHVIVTSYVFHDGHPDRERLKEMRDTVSKERLVLDVSCKKAGEEYFLVTDRWQRMTNVRVDGALLDELSEYCGEFLLHAVDAEGKRAGVETEAVAMLGEWAKSSAFGEKDNRVTYAGGVRSAEDLHKVRTFGNNRVDVTVGSALSIFGGDLELDSLLQALREA